MVRSGNLLLCLRVAVAGGARWAKMTRVGRFSRAAFNQLASFLCLGITCKSSIVVNVATKVWNKETAVMDALVRCQKEIYPCTDHYKITCSPFFPGSSKGSTSEERQNGKEHRAAKG